jgi:hypothetical protein
MSEEAVEQVIDRVDGVRSSPVPVGAGASWEKEWFHFAILGQREDTILNLSFGGDARPAAAPGERVARTILLVHDHGWFGGIESTPERDIEIGPGLRVQLGNNVVRFEGGRFILSAALEGRPASLYLMARPLTRPLLVEGDRAARQSGWAVIPRLVGRGSVVAGRRVHRLEEALIYHDHNWGRWRWGDDLSWEWGFGLPDDPSVPWSLVFSRTSDRARGLTSSLRLLAWNGESMIRRFDSAEIRITPEGQARSIQVPKVPPPMAMLAPELTTEVPERLHVEADSGDDRLALDFKIEAIVQILVPNERDLGVTVINETVGRVRADGRIAGETVRMDGRGHIEFVRG